MHSIGSPMDGAHPSAKTDRARLIKDNVGLVSALQLCTSFSLIGLKTGLPFLTASL